MRSFLTRIPSALFSVVLLVPCLPIYLGCATSFPVEDLEAGMLAEAARDEFGEPEAIENGSGDAGSCWCYHDDEQDWLFTFFPLTPLFIPIAVANGRWDYYYVNRKTVTLHFEEEKLVRWEMRKPSGWFVREYPSFRTNAFGEEVFEAGDTYMGHAPDCNLAQAHTEGQIKAGDTCQVARNYVSLWLEPSASGERQILDSGQPMRVIGRRCQWCHVEDESGKQGWVACVFLESESP